MSSVVMITVKGENQGKFGMFVGTKNHYLMKQAEKHHNLSGSKDHGVYSVDIKTE